MGYKQFWEIWDGTSAFKSPSQGVATHIFAAFHPDLDKPGELIDSMNTGFRELM